LGVYCALPRGSIKSLPRNRPVHYSCCRQAHTGNTVHRVDANRLKAFFTYVQTARLLRSRSTATTAVKPTSNAVRHIQTTPASNFSLFLQQFLHIYGQNTAKQERETCIETDQRCTRVGLTRELGRVINWLGQKIYKY